MLHKNNTGKKTKVRLINKKLPSGFEWKTVKPGKEIDMHPDDGIAYGFDLIEKPIEETPAEDPKDKKSKKEAYWKRIVSINGIGAKTADQIVFDYPTEAKLKLGLKKEPEDVTSRDDLVEKLKAEFL